MPQVKTGKATIVSADDARQLLVKQGIYPVADRPAEFAAQIRRETAVWARVIREAGVKAE